MKVNRRAFLRTSALATATAVAQGHSAADAASSSNLPVLGPDVRWDKAPCRFCGTGCHVSVGVADGRVVAVAGDREADVNRGLLCVKGYHVGSILYGKDRLTRPLLRKNGSLVPIEWDEALDIFAKRRAACRITTSNRTPACAWPRP